MRLKVLAGLVSTASVLIAWPAGGHMGASGVVKERMELMKSMAAAMKTIGKMARGEQTLDGARATDASGTLVRHGPRIHALFPAGSGGGVSEASPDIWRDAQRFREHADALVDRSARLHEAAKSNDIAAIRTAYRAVGKACSACHKRFRVKKHR